MKKILFSMGSIVLVVVPVVATVSCGTTTLKLDLRGPDSIKRMNRITSFYEKIAKALESKYWKKISCEITNISGKTKTFTLVKGNTNNKEIYSHIKSFVSGLE